MLFSLAQIDTDTVPQIQTLERDKGKTIVVFKGIEATPAELDSEALDGIQALEQKLGLTLVAEN